MNHDPNTPQEVAERRQTVRRVLNSEIHDLLEDVYKTSYETGGSEAREMAVLVSSFSGLMARLGKESERLTNWIVRLTIGLFILTLGLLALTAYLCQDIYEHHRADQKAAASKIEEPPHLVTPP